MKSISLIIPISGTDVPTGTEIASYCRVLRDQAHASSVEVILAGDFSAAVHAPGATDSILIPTAGTGKIAALREGMDAASNELLVVLDPHRAYPPQAIVEVIEGLLISDADFAIAVPRRDRHRSWWRALGRRCLGSIGQLTLGTSDVFSGLIAIRPGRLRVATNLHHARGSRLVLDLLAWPTTAHRDIPVETRPDDRLHVGPLRFDDIRQLKRLLDHRFGTMSRLVQFCMVGASGMVVDLTLYALLQLLFARFWSLPAGSPASGFSWPLATAGALAIFTAMVWNFALNRRLTFNDSRGGSIPRQFLTYALGNALGIAVSLSIRLFLPQYFGFFTRHRLAAAVVGIIVATGISFSMSRWVVFIRRPAGAGGGAGAVGRRSLPVKAALQESAAVS
ncbi:MAG: GtrA family protein [Planctomycetaceae bacterium]|nr:GtrA family protein [Planctomycetaceae bacterium]